MSTDTFAWDQISRLFAGEVVAGLSLLGDDPMVGLTERRPILLLETSDTMLVRDPATDRTYELQVELLARQGFRRLTPETAVPEPLPGWTLRPRSGQLELTDQHGNPWVTADITPDGDWLAAASEGQVVVLYGACLGVCPPGGVPLSQYGPPQRAAELRFARRQGFVAAATVAWEGQR